MVAAMETGSVAAAAVAAAADSSSSVRGFSMVLRRARCALIFKRRTGAGDRHGLFVAVLPGLCRVVYT